jgi:hypothetical protein
VPEAVVRGSDASLATAAVCSPGALFGFEPDSTSDVANALGLASSATPAGTGGTEVVLDMMCVVCSGGLAVSAVNAVVIGAAPRATRWTTGTLNFEISVDAAAPIRIAATGVIIASGQYSGGDDVNPRSHPGDGKLEAHAYSLRRSERAGMRARLRTGSHVPHPRITQRSGALFRVATDTPVAVAVDGVTYPTSRDVEVSVSPGALRLLVPHA